MPSNPKKKSKKPASVAARPDLTVINQWFSTSSIEGLEVLSWFYGLGQFAKKGKSETKAPIAASRNQVCELALRHFVKKYKSKRPEYNFAPAEGDGHNTSVRVASDVFVGIKLIAQRDRRALEHTVETAIQDFLADILTPEMREFHSGVVTRGLGLLTSSDPSRRA